jgi:hypothetical protein
MSDLTPGSQNEGNPNDYQQLKQNNMGALDKAVQDIHNFKLPSVEGASGSDGFNTLTEMAVTSKGGAVGFMANLHADTSIENSSFFGSTSKGKPRDKKSVALANKIKMVTSNSHPVTGKLSKQQNLALWKEVRRELSGFQTKSKNPMSGSSGFGFTGEKTGAAHEKRFPTKADLLNNSSLMAEAGLSVIGKNLNLISSMEKNRTIYEDMKGTDMNFDDAKASLKNQPKDDVMRVATTTLTDEKQDTVAQTVLDVEKYHQFRLNHDKSVEAQRQREEMEEKARGLAAGTLAHQAAGPAAPVPTWAQQPTHKEEEKKT